jgi:Domain of unknown function (DUF397)
MELTSATWRTSSYTGGNGGNCVEVGNADNAVVVRDTKNRQGVVLTFGQEAFREFVASLKQDY